MAGDGPQRIRAGQRASVTEAGELSIQGSGLEHADVEIAIPGKPGEMAGTATLVEAGGRTTERVDLESPGHVDRVLHERC